MLFRSNCKIMIALPNGKKEKKKYIYIYIFFLRIVVSSKEKLIKKDQKIRESYCNYK